MEKAVSISIKIGGIEERILVERMQQGDTTAFELLFKYYYPGLVVFASNIVINKDEAEELVQDFFVRLWENRHSLKSDNPLKNYLFTSVKNRSINFLKSVQVKKNVIEELKRQMESEMRYNPDIYTDTELQQKLKLAFTKLPPRTAEIFTLSRFKGLSNDEIALSLELSKRTVETQISNALKILRKELQNYLTLLLFF
ncbi:RNA polymerase sigma-70 factor [Maribellus luteus]|uniref:RNA polymerase sigma-70 factor n=1 Tax=Maribellus luteus TaxID=2305463 RepID=A0A399T6X0_9BACT|nr:RNA polymerase sigma-70 factor [Maribellus luteus]RIJ49917.1 RNA polymerase sigma-70 factor [Maribellus luteus]